MARPVKEGLDYFPFDTVLDDDVRYLQSEFGLKGFAIFVMLKMKIYRQHGYYCEWNSRVASMFCRYECGIDKQGQGTVLEVVDFALKIGLFDDGMYKTHGILTSRKFQENYLNATKQRNVEIEEAYSLINNASKSISIHDNSPAGGVSIHDNSPAGGVSDSKNPINNIKENKKKLNNKKTYTSGESADHGDKSPRFNYQLFGDYWNHNIAEPTGLPTVREPSKWTSTRKTNLKARVKDEGEKAVLKIFDEVKQSDFLSGRANGFQATFDWVIKAGNFQKIADGNYKNRNRQKQEDNPFLAYALGEKEL